MEVLSRFAYGSLEVLSRFGTGTVRFVTFFLPYCITRRTHISAKTKTWTSALIKAHSVHMIYYIKMAKLHFSWIIIG